MKQDTLCTVNFTIRHSFNFYSLLGVGGIQKFCKMKKKLEHVMQLILMKQEGEFKEYIFYRY